MWNNQEFPFKHQKMGLNAGDHCQHFNEKITFKSNASAFFKLFFLGLEHAAVSQHTNQYQPQLVSFLCPQEVPALFSSASVNVDAAIKNQKGSKVRFAYQKSNFSLF